MTDYYYGLTVGIICGFVGNWILCAALVLAMFWFCTRPKSVHLPSQMDDRSWAYSDDQLRDRLRDYQRRKNRTQHD